MKQQVGALILRIALGLVFAGSGFMKFKGGIANTVGWFESINIPGFLAYFVAGIELVGGILLIIGLATRIISALFVIIMVGAIVTVKFSAGFVGGYDFDIALMAMALFLAIAGSGQYAVDQFVFNKESH